MSTLFFFAPEKFKISTPPLEAQGPRAPSLDPPLTSTTCRSCERGSGMYRDRHIRGGEWEGKAKSKIQSKVQSLLHGDGSGDL